MQPLELGPEFTAALDAIEKEGKSVFLTGRAGTGKSTLLQLFRKTTQKKVVALAPTGVAALNVQGQTIHSFFGLPPRLISKQEIKKRKDRRVLKALEVLIIDEISMVRADLLDNIDYSLQINRDSRLPFGGVQVVFVGDLYQLPPVLTREEQGIFESRYSSPYFFAAEVFQRGFKLELIELRKVYRQDNRHFLRLLDAIRLNHLDEDDLADLNSRYLPNFEPEDYYITLTARNATADAINTRELAKLDSQTYSYQAEITGDFNPLLFPTDQILRLKKGAQVMLIKNSPDGNYVNGTLGMIVDLFEDQVRVAIENREQDYEEIDVIPQVWEIIRYKTPPDNFAEIETEVIGTFTQFPLRLAWAVTIHKAQGKTFRHVVIDLGAGAFEHGQTYVALSRCRSLEGIVLKRKIQLQDVITDERILEYYQWMEG
jgi:ATP-dependent DNA helicase PIF1